MMANSRYHIAYQNANSICSAEKQEAFRAGVLATAYDVICVTETWAKLHTIWANVFGEGYKVFYNNRCYAKSKKERGGGVVIAVRNTITSEPIKDCTSLEQVWVKIENDLAIGCVYLPPELARKTCCMEAHVKSVSHLEKMEKYSQIIVVGDYNQPSLNWKSNSNGAAMLVGNPSPKGVAKVLLDGFDGFSQYNCVENYRKRTLDLVWSNKPLKGVVKQSRGFGKLDSHHPPLEFVA